MNAFFIKKIGRLIGKTSVPNIKSEEYDKFFNSPLWLILRQIAILQINSAMDEMVTTNDNVVRSRCAGLIQGLQFVTECEEQMKHLVTENEDLLTAGREAEALLKKIFNLTEDIK